MMVEFLDSECGEGSNNFQARRILFWMTLLADLASVFSVRKRFYASSSNLEDHRDQF